MVLDSGQVPNSDANSSDEIHDLSITDASDAASDICLPSSYIEVTPCIMPSSLPVVPFMPVTLMDFGINSMSAEYDWLGVVKAAVDGQVKCDNFSWAAYHAAHDKRDRYVRPILSLLPLFKHNANTPGMMKHCLTVIQRAVHKLNSG